MKKLARLLLILSVVCIMSCVSSSSYDPQTCAALVERIKDKQELTEKDYDQMVDQFCAIVKWMAQEKKDAGDNEEAYKKALSSDEGKEKSEYLIYFALEFEEGKDKLSASNVAKMATYMKEMKELTK